MSWQKIEKAFYVIKDGKFQSIDVGICDNCNGIHIPPEEASACEHKGQEETYENLLKRIENLKTSPNNDFKKVCPECGFAVRVQSAKLLPRHKLGCSMKDKPIIKS